MLTSNIGTWAHDVGAAWLMTALTPSELLVSLLQTAASVPVLLLALPAGSLADIVDRRRLLIGANLTIAVAAALLSLAAVTGAITPIVLLGLTFVIGVGAAFGNPAWQATTPELVPPPLVPAASTLGGVSVNLARAVGPALGGLIVALAGPPAVFLLNAACTTVIVIVVARWRPEARASMAPGERLFGAMRAGARFARHSEELRPVLVRALAFTSCGSALWALLPILGRQTLGLNAMEYGILLGALGAGAVTASQFLPAWRRRLNIDALVTAASLVLAVLLALLSTLRSFPAAAAVMFAIGAAWIAVLPTFNVAAIFALPPWVRARGLAIYNLVFMGGTAIGGVLWGTVASSVGVSTALLIAAAGLAATTALAHLFPLRQGEGVDLSPAGHWPTIDRVVAASAIDAGPVMVTVEYQIDIAQRDEFLRLVHATEAARRRDGAYAWGIYQDVKEHSRYVESFLVESWSEHLRQHARVTKHDQAHEAVARAFHIGPEPPVVRHLLHADIGRAADARADFEESS
jgi:MFS family permease